MEKVTEAGICFERERRMGFLAPFRKIHMLWLYRFLFVPALALAAPYYGWRMWRRGGYGADFAQRFGRPPQLPPRRPGVRRIWVQAVSVGEVLALAPLLEAWRTRGDTEVYLTTTTSTGRALAEVRYRERGLVMAAAYFPLDFAPFSARVWNAVQPDLAVILEGERWPEHLHQAARRGVPTAVVNARLSDRSLRRMRRLGPLARLLVRDLTRVLAVGEADAERFATFGVPPAAVTVTGNLKLDVTLPEVEESERKRLRKELGLGDAPLLVGASTWPGEEAALVEAWQPLRKSGWKLLLVPRHAERRADVAAILAAAGVRFHFRSQGVATSDVDVAVADTTGELSRLLTLAELVFIGKTLPPHTEGQTPVEAAARGKAALFGPGTANFRSIASELVAAGAVRRVENATQLAQAVAELAQDEPMRRRMADAGPRWHAINRGATSRTLQELDRLLAEKR